METYPEDFVQQDAPRIDIKRVLYRVIRHWYIFILTLGIGITYAVLKTRYTPKIYPVYASIIIRETEEVSSGGEILYHNDIVDPYRNYLNELYILRSVPLIESVINDLRFDVSFYQEGSVITSEIYNFPVEVDVINKKELSNLSLGFAILNANQFHLIPSTAAGKDGVAQTFSFGDTVDFKGMRAVFRVKEKFKQAVTQSTRHIFSYTPAVQVAGGYASRVAAAWVEKGAGVVNLSVTGNNPQKEVDFLAGLIRRFQQNDIEKKSLKASKTIDFISKQLRDISDSLRHVEGTLEHFKSKHPATELSGDTRDIFQKINDFEAQKTDMVLNSNYRKYLTDYIQRGKDLDLVILPSQVGLQDGLLGEFLRTMVTIESDLKRVTSHDRPDNPLVQQKRTKLQEVKNDIAEAVRNQQNVDKIKTDFLNNEIKALEKKLELMPATERQYTAIRRNYTLLENLYIFLLQKQAEVGISKASAVSNIELVNEPSAGGPIFPKPSQNYSLAIILALGLPIAFFVGLEYLNNKIQSREDIEKLTAIPFLGGIGHKTSDDNMVVMKLPRSPMAESFRALRSNLSYFTKDKDRSVVLVSSSVSGEGKTFTSINLASVIANAGKKTLIVGADLRRPKIFQDFGITNDKGLSTYLAGLSDLDEIVQKSGIENLDIVTGGPVPPNPGELILRPRMEEFFKETKGRYEFIVIDTPPIAIVSDALELNKYADHLVFIVRQNFTQKDFIKSMDEFYLTGRVKNLSILLNDIYKSGPGYGYGSGYGYSYGYGYYAKEKNGYGYYSES